MVQSTLLVTKPQAVIAVATVRKKILNLKRFLRYKTASGNRCCNDMALCEKDFAYVTKPQAVITVATAANAFEQYRNAFFKLQNRKR